MTFGGANLRHHDRIRVRRDGEELEVYNCVNIKTIAVVRGGNPTVERFHGETEVAGGESGKQTPDAVTHWVANELRREFNYDPVKYGIEVINPTSEDVIVL